MSLNQPVQLSCDVLVNENEKISEDLIDPFYYPDRKEPDPTELRNKYHQQRQKHDEKTKYAEENISKHPAIEMSRQKRDHIKKHKEESEPAKPDESAEKSRERRSQRHNESETIEEDEESAENAPVNINSSGIVQRYRDQRMKHSNTTTRTKRSINEDLFFTWYKDDEEITISSENETDQLYVMSSNGTLTFKADNKTSGEYHCRAKHLITLINHGEEQQQIFIGPIISKTTRVQIGCEYNQTLVSSDRNQITFIVNHKTLRANN